MIAHHSRGHMTSLEGVLRTSPRPLSWTLQCSSAAAIACWYAPDEGHREGSLVKSLRPGDILAVVAEGPMERAFRASRPALRPAGGAAVGAGCAGRVGGASGPSGPPSTRTGSSHKHDPAWTWIWTLAGPSQFVRPWACSLSQARKNQCPLRSINIHRHRLSGRLGGPGHC